MASNSKNHKITNNDSLDTLNWPESDILKMLKLLEEQIPHDDRLFFKSRANKIPWEKITFDDYTEEDCKNMWELISRRLRRFRLLSEMVTDAKIWLNRPWTNFYSKKASNTHPDKPKRPLSGLQIYTKEQHQSIRKQNPDASFKEIFSKIINSYKALSAEEKKVYIERSRLLKEEYVIKLKTFLNQHPDEGTLAEKKLTKADVISESALKLYLDDQILSIAENSDKPLKKLVKEYTKNWNELGEEERLEWFNRAKQNSKPEKNLKSSKAKTGVISVYNFYIKKMMKCQEIQSLPPDKRFKALSTHWKSLSKQEKHDILDERAEFLKASGIEVPLNKTEAKKRKNDDGESQIPKKKQRKIKNIETTVEEISEDKPKSKVIQEALAREPKQPPEEPIKLFKKDMRRKHIKYTNEQELSEAWEALTKSEKKTYKRRLKHLKTTYLQEYESFITSLTKKELKAYNKSKQIVGER